MLRYRSDICYTYTLYIITSSVRVCLSSWLPIRATWPYINVNYTDHRGGGLHLFFVQYNNWNQSINILTLVFSLFSLDMWNIIVLYGGPWGSCVSVILLLTGRAGLIIRCCHIIDVLSELVEQNITAIMVQYQLVTEPSLSTGWLGKDKCSD